MNLGKALRPILRSPAAAWAIGAVVAGYIGLVARTTRWTEVDREDAEAADAGPHGFIATFWHNRLMMGAIIRRRTTRGVYMLSSRHVDSEPIIAAARRFGVSFIRGSAANPKKAHVDKGGGSALFQMIAALRAGNIVAITPDGPRGPARRAQIGVVKLAQLAGVRMLSGAYSVDRGVFLKTWDRLFIPLPFGRGWFVGGPAIDPPPPDADEAHLEAKRAELERALNLAADRADALAGWSHAAPAPE
jgi:lysophospholipid acyltransferase (LPLAT)-like uncharacterized protein